MSVEAILRRADELALDTIAITDHVFRRQDMAITQQIAAEAARCTSRCRVIVGAEVDVDGRYADGRLVADQLDAIDYVIAGFHYVPTAGNYPHKPDDCPLRPEEFLKVWRSSLLGIVTNPSVDTLAHPGRLVGAAVDMDVYFDDVLAIYAEAAEYAAANNVAFEINELTGQRLSDHYRGQWYRIYEVALAAGVRLVYGSDAHDPLSMATDDFARLILQKLPPGCLSEPDDVLKAAR
jgi:histidinol phosphatase-like PHP family hydrolase